MCNLFVDAESNSSSSSSYNTYKLKSRKSECNCIVSHSFRKDDVISCKCINLVEVN